LSAHVDPVRRAAAWERLDLAVDEPRRGPIERVLIWLNVPEHIARIAVTTRALSVSWIGTAAAILILAAMVPRLSNQPNVLLFFLVVSPVLPVLGVAVSFGPLFDPTYEMAAVAPVGRLWLILLRTASVLVLAVAMAGGLTLVLPDHGMSALAWLLPALALTSVSVALAARMDATWAALVSAGVWTVLVVATTDFVSGRSFAFQAAGQLVSAGVAMTAVLAIYLLRGRFELGIGLPTQQSRALI